MHGNAIRHAQTRQEVLDAAKYVLDEWPNKCKRGSSISAAAIARIIDDKAPIWWGVGGEPPLTQETMTRQISNWLKTVE